MRILGPSDLLSVATSVRDGVSDIVLDLPATVTDILDLMGRAGELVERADALLTSAEAMLARGETAVSQVEAMLEDGEGMLDRVAGVLADSEQAVAGVAVTIAGAQEVTREAGVTVEAVTLTNAGAADLVRRADAMVTPIEPVAQRLTPIAERAAAQLEGHDVEELLRMAGRLPSLLAQLEKDLLPGLIRLEPEVHEILESVHELTRVLSGLPGATMFKRRGERKEEESDDAALGRSVTGS